MFSRVHFSCRVKDRLRGGLGGWWAGTRGTLLVLTSGEGWRQLRGGLLVAERSRPIWDSRVGGTRLNVQICNTGRERGLVVFCGQALGLKMGKY